MTTLQTVLDAVMSLFWTITYVVAYRATRKYQYPAISLVFQFLCLSHEIAILIHFFISRFSFNYAFLAYILWIIIETATVLHVFKKHKQRISPGRFFLAVAALSAVTIPLLRLENGMLFVTYGYTAVGMVFWYIHIWDEHYPLRPLNLLCFVTKFIADFTALFVYFPSGPVVIKVISVTLPLMDVAFIATFAVRYFSVKKKGVKPVKKKVSR